MDLLQGSTKMDQLRNHLAIHECNPNFLHSAWDINDPHKGDQDYEQYGMI